MKIHYLVSATGFVKTDSGHHSGRSFTFDVVLDAPWGGETQSIGDMAYAEFVKAFRCHPPHNPQIDAVTRVESAKTDAVSVVRAIFALVDGAEKQDVWDHVTAYDIFELIPEWATEAITPPAPAPEPEDFDDLI